MTNTTHTRIDQEIAKAHDNAINALNGRTAQHNTTRTLQETCDINNKEIIELVNAYMYNSAISVIEDTLQAIENRSIEMKIELGSHTP